MQTISPAYGRDYTNKLLVIADLNEGKDFVLQSMFGSGYLNKDDIEGTSVMIRYQKMRKVLVANKVNGTWVAK